MHTTRLRKPTAGMTLIEIVAALAVLSIGIMGVVSALISITTLENANHDELVAINVAKQKLAEIQTAPFQSIFTFYGPTSNSGKFTVGQLDSGYGQIQFPVRDGKLCETVEDIPLGMPQDLNGNGNKTDTNVSTTYTLLPVRIHLEWTSTTGKRELNMNTMLTKVK